MQRAELDARVHGYRLNPDPEFLQALIEGLCVNEERYGYPSCPCRIATGIFAIDRDIICPCDYRDPDSSSASQRSGRSRRVRSSDARRRQRCRSVLGL